jgi:hypothetical protein
LCGRELRLQIFGSAFFEDLPAFIDAGPQLPLRFFRQRNNFHALGGAALVVFFCARAALNKQQVAAIVFAIGVIIARLPALVAMGNHIVGDALAQAFIEHEIFADEFVFKALLFYLACVFDDAAIELIYVLEAAVLHPRAGLFAADAARAVHQQILALVFVQKIFRYLQLLPEGVYIGADGSPEMAHFTLVMVAHVDDQRVGSLGHGVELCSIQMNARIGYIKARIIKAIGYNFFAHQDFEFEK